MEEEEEKRQWWGSQPSLGGGPYNLETSQRSLVKNLVKVLSFSKIPPSDQAFNTRTFLLCSVSELLPVQSCKTETFHWRWIWKTTMLNVLAKPRPKICTPCWASSTLSCIPSHHCILKPVTTSTERGPWSDYTSYKIKIASNMKIHAMIKLWL